MAAATAPPPAAVATTLSGLMRCQNIRSSRPRAFYARCASSNASAEAAESRKGGHGGTRLEEAVPVGEGRSRVDAWISARLGGGGVSRARVQASIRAGLVAVNGRPVSKVPLLSRVSRLCLLPVKRGRMILVLAKPWNMLLIHYCS